MINNVRKITFISSCFLQDELIYTSTDAFACCFLSKRVHLGKCYDTKNYLSNSLKNNPTSLLLRYKLVIPAPNIAIPDAIGIAEPVPVLGVEGGVTITTGVVGFDGGVVGTGSLVICTTVEVSISSFTITTFVKLLVVALLIPSVEAIAW